MARFLTVSVECQNDKIRGTLLDVLANRRGIIVAHGKGAGADMVVLELDEASPHRTFGTIRTMLAARSQTEIFLTANRTDPQVMLEAFRSGVKEFIPQPINRQEVEAALGRFEERAKERIATSDDKAGIVMGLMGAKGGMGTTTVAINLAMSVKQVAPQRSVALVDLNRHDSDIPLFLDLPVPRGLRDLSEDVSRLDETILRSVLVTHESGVDILQSGYDGLDGLEPTQGCVLRTLDLMRSIYDYVIVDCGHVLENGTKEALDYCSNVVIVLTLSVPAIRRTKRLLGLLQSANYGPDKLSVLVNRYSARDQELLRHSEETLLCKMAGTIPNEFMVVNEAISHGKPLKAVAPKSPLTQWYLQYAAAVAKRHKNSSHILETETKTQGSFLARYLPRLGFDGRTRVF